MPTTCDRRRRPLSPAVLLALALLAPLVTAAGCGTADEVSDEAQGEPETEGRSTANGAGAVAAQAWLADIEVGHEVDSEGAIPLAQRADEFAPGERVFVSMEVSDAPELAEVHVMFRDAAGETVAEDAKKVPAEARYLYFDSGDTTHWSPGTYRLIVAVDGEAAAERELAITGNPLDRKGEPG